MYFELRIRGYEVYVGQFYDMEIDFVTINGKETAYYQISATILDENVLRRELAPLREVCDNYLRYLPMLDKIFGAADYYGIKKVNILKWLMI